MVLRQGWQDGPKSPRPLPRPLGLHKTAKIDQAFERSMLKPFLAIDSPSDNQIRKLITDCSSVLNPGQVS